MTADKDKRRALSKEAARVRRRAESEVFCDLKRLLPLPATVCTPLDKPSIIRLTISYLRTHTLLTGSGVSQMSQSRVEEQRGGLGETTGDRQTGGSWGSPPGRGWGETDLFLQILGGFFIIVTTEGHMIYLSENVSQHMGLTQVELMGHSMFEFSHPCDHEDIKDKLCSASDEWWPGRRRNFLMRMKSTITHSGRITNLKSACWKVLHCQGCVKVCVFPSPLTCLLILCQPLPLSHTLVHTHSFTSQHSMDLRFLHCDQRVGELLGYCPEELLGHSVYELCHTMDQHSLSRSHRNLCSKGQSVSGLYRLLVKRGGYVWAESHSAVISSPRLSKTNYSSHQPPCVLSVTYILSGVEEPSLLLSLDQALCGHVS
ncbi:endothelial PAS domain-containing protein 1 [Osmerus mordax]|uniref:endothelial PAS domain-containing protein 1 n=1 Tax=Osmerus mordax TaxID=8014 RepID=UPI00350FD328